MDPLRPCGSPQNWPPPGHRDRLGRLGCGQFPVGVRGQRLARRRPDPSARWVPAVRAGCHDVNMTAAVQWGSVATWVASVGTVTAVSLALWRAAAERKERLRRELRQQAERIAAWYAGMGEDPDGEKSGRDAGLSRQPRGEVAVVELLNTSDGPVYDVVVFLALASYKIKDWWNQEPHHRVMIGVLPPGHWVIGVPVNGGFTVPAQRAEPPAAPRVIVIISFTDKAVNHWARGARGELRRLDCDPIEYWKIDTQAIQWQVLVHLPEAKGG